MKQKNMAKQLSIFDILGKPKEPPCYSCTFAIRRGRFRLCAIGKKGYKKIGIWEFCKSWKEVEK